MNFSKTSIMTALACVVLSAPLQAQNPILNPGFEIWSGDELVDWGTTNDAAPGSVTQSSDAHSGSSAARGNVLEVFPGYRIGPWIQAGDMGMGFATQTRWGALEGYYKFNAVGGDHIIVFVALFTDTLAVGVGSVLIDASASSYQLFSVPIFYADSTTTPDSAYAYAMLMGANTEQGPDTASYFLFDDWSMTMSAPPVCPVTLTGDVNGTGDRVTSDIIYLVNYVLKGGAVPIPCRAAGDVNCDGNVATSDIIYLVNSVLKGGPAPCDVCSLIPGTHSCP